MAQGRSTKMFIIRGLRITACVATAPTRLLAVVVLRLLIRVVLLGVGVLLRRVTDLCKAHRLV